MIRKRSGRVTPRLLQSAKNPTRPSGARRIPHFRVCGRVPATNSRGFLLCLHSSPAFERSARELQSVAICGMGTNCRRCGAIGRVHQSLCPALTHGLSTFHRCRGRGSVIRAGSLGTWVRTGSRDLGYCSRVREERACAVTADRACGTVLFPYRQTPTPVVLALKTFRGSQARGKAARRSKRSFSSRFSGTSSDGPKNGGSCRSSRVVASSGHRLSGFSSMDLRHSASASSKSWVWTSSAQFARWSTERLESEKRSGRAGAGADSRRWTRMPSPPDWRTCERKCPSGENVSAWTFTRCAT